MLPSLANSSGSALAQKPLWDTRSGQAYLGSESGWMRDGSLLVKPSRSAPLQQHCFFVIWVAGAWPQTDPQPSLPAPAISEPKGKGLYPCLQPTPGRLLWGVTLPSSPTVGSPPPGNPRLPPPTTLILFPSPPHGRSPFYFLLYHTGKAEKRVRSKRRNEGELKWQQRGKRWDKVGDGRKQKRGSPEAPGNAATGAGREAPPSA